MKTIYLIAGVAGSGKSWVMDRLPDHCLKIKSDEVKVDKVLEMIRSSNKKIVFLEKTVHISTFIKKSKHEFDIVPIFVGVDFLRIKRQIKNRGGRITKSLYRRFKRMNTLCKRFNTFYGESEDVLKYLKGLLGVATNVCGLHVPWNLEILTHEEHVKAHRKLDKQFPINNKL